MSLFDFDASQVSPDSNSVPIPAGVYVAQIVESDVKNTKNSGGQYLKLSWKVIDGPHANRMVFQNINFRNANAEAERIGQAQLSAICHAVGVLRVSNTQQLHGKPCKIKVIVRKGEGEYSDQNDVKAVESAGAMVARPPMAASGPSAAAPFTSANTAASAPAADTRPPWAKQAA